jgi:hypothetical protein
LPATDKGRIFIEGSAAAIDVRVVSGSANRVNLAYLDQARGDALVRDSMKRRSAAA